MFFLIFCVFMPPTLIHLNSWSPDTAISEGLTSQPGQHNIVCDASGGAHAVWSKWAHYGVSDTVLYSYYTGTHWTTAQPISIPLSMIFACHPSIATWMGNIYCAWENNWWYYDIVLRRFWGGNWEDTLIVISSGTKYTYTPSVACDYQGVLHIVWEKEYEIHYRNLYGSVLSDDIVLSNSGVYAAYPSIATFDNKVFVVWEDLRDGNFEIYFKEFNGNQWSEEIRVTNSTTASLFPSLCVDSIGVVHIAYQEDGVEGYKVYYTSNEQGNFSVPTLIVDSPGEAITASITSIGEELHFVWSDSRDGDWEIYYKNYSATWGDDTRLTYSSGISANPSICASNDGTLYLLFWDTRVPPAQVYFKKRSSPKKGEPATQELTVTPNPFTQKTVIAVSNVGVQYIEPLLQIYDLAGRIVKTLPIPNPQSPIAEVVWDGRDDRGVELNSGVYFVHCRGEVSSPLRQKIILIR